MDELEEGECEEDGRGGEEEGESEGELEIATAGENGGSKEESGVVLSAIEQELRKDMSRPCSGGRQPEARGRPTTAEESEGEEETEDKVPSEKLEELAHCEAIRSMLANPHLRELLIDLDRSHTPQQTLRRAMNIPVFTEFADQCLRVCRLRGDDDDS